MTRERDLDRLYDLLAHVEAEVGGKPTLQECDGYMDWPDRGVYFFFAPDETRDTADQLRLTRIGTHAVSEGSQTSLWNRLRTHRGAMRGSYEGGGNHRGSVFRKRVGEAIIERDGIHEAYPEWAEGNTADRELRMDELDLERQVSEFIRDLPFLWVGIDDEPGPESDRAYVERNAIALVSNLGSRSIDARVDEWLGHHSPVDEIRESGLWNINHVGEEYDPDFLDVLEQRVDGENRARSQIRSNKAGSSSPSCPEPDDEPRQRVEAFDETWAQIVRFADSESGVGTLGRGNQNDIQPGEAAIEVRNRDTDEWRRIERDDFAFAYGILEEKGELRLDDIEPELAGRKSIVTAILAKALDLEYDSRPITVYL